MVDRQSQDDAAAMAGSVLFVVGAGVAFAYLGFAANPTISTREVALGVGAGVLVVAAQTAVALRYEGMEGLFGDSTMARVAAGGAAGILGAAAIDVAPAVAAVFGVALVPLGVVSRLFLYRRASRD